ncbi:MAG: cytochrome-c peroxidase, partial [Phycisphaerales bacterium]|nr:cytochrome-c peroxidase [Phycisphaerales bacterium]
MTNASPSPAPRNARTRSRRAGVLASLSLIIAAGSGFTYYAMAALPAMPFPPANPFSEEKRVLGKILFWDEQLSTSMAVSCGTCHSFNRAGSDPRVARNPGNDNILNNGDDILASPGIILSDAQNDFQRDPVFGIAPQITDRSSISPINAGYAPQLFWDGRASGQFIDPQTGVVAINAGGALESQAVAPLLNNVEMAHAGFDWATLNARMVNLRPLDLATNIPADVATVLGSKPSYPELFRRAFGTSEISARRVAFAIATYQRTLISDQSPWARFVAGQSNALTPNQQNGLTLYQNQGKCNLC